MRRTWVNVADVVLGAALLVAAVAAGAGGRPLEAVAAVVLGLAWGVRGAVGLRRGTGPAPDLGPAPAGPAGPLPATR
ncbi:hypothetical protein [Kineococcus radiotolerans]|uniref:hypothetical protein n=1 Tax=Kineococcus radiotolerans TaxID=131568 RepID=UPI0012FEEB38|nr:hypothetical protein [Kineococcus radiotolerans]